MSQPDFESVPQELPTPETATGTANGRMHNILQCARELGAILTVAGVMGGAVTVQSPSDFNSKGESGIAVCSSEDLGDQCAIEDGAIDLRRVAQITRTDPSPVIADERSVVTVISFGKDQNNNSASSEGGSSTGYVVRNSEGQNVVRSAGHSVDDTGELSHLTFNVITNVDGKRRVDPVTAFQLPSDFSPQTQTDQAHNTDESQLTVPKNGWTKNLHTTNGVGVHGGENGFDKIRPIPEDGTHLPIGTIVYDETVRRPEGGIYVAPYKPRIAPMVVAGYLEGPGDRVVLVSEDQEHSAQQWMGSSGGPIVRENGNGFATEIESYQVSAKNFVLQMGVRLAGYAIADNLVIEIGTLDNADAQHDVNSAVPQLVPSAYSP